MQPLLAPGSGFDWRSALTAGISLSFKPLCEEKVFASDAVCFMEYTPEYLVHLECAAFAEWLPKIAHVHALAFHFRTSLIDLALDTLSVIAPTPKYVTILIIEENGALRAEYEAVARAVAPNATILCTHCYAAARDQTLARMGASLPMHLVLTGAGMDESVPLSTARVRAMKEFSRAVDPREGAIRIDMHGRPLLVAVAIPSCADRQVGLRAELRTAGVDAVLPGGRITAPALRTLLDFICERNLAQYTPTESPIDELSAVTASREHARIPAKGAPVPTPIAACVAIAFEAQSEVAMAEAFRQPVIAAWARGTPVPTPRAARVSIADDVSRPPSRQTSGHPQQASLGDGGAASTPRQFALAAPAGHATPLALWPIPLGPTSSLGTIMSDLCKISERDED